MTTMPASMALRATAVMAAPSNGSRTIASTLSLMNVSTCEIWRLTSLVPSATFSSTSSYLAACALADLVIEPIQPWSAAGAEKPMTTFLPDLSLSVLLLPIAELVSPSSEPFVQAPRTSVAAAKAPTRAKARRLREWMVDMCNSWCEVVTGRSGLAVRDALLEEHSDHDDHALRDVLGRRREVVEREDVGEGGEDQHAEERADDGPSSPAEQRAADDDGGDRVQL